MSGERSNRFAVYIALGKILAMVAQFAMPLFLTRFLSKSDYGVYAQFYLVLGFLGSIFAFGIQSSLFYFYPISKSETEKKQLVYNTILLLLVLGTLGSSILFISPIADFIIGSELSNYLYIVIATIFLFIPSNIILPLSTVRKDKWLSVIFPPLEVLLKVAIVIPLALYTNSLYGIFVGIFVLQVIIFAYIILYIVRRYGWGRFGKTSIPLIKQQLSYALPFGFAVILNTVCQRIDKILCVSTLSAEEYAVYSVAFFGIPGVIQIYDALCQVNIVNMASAFKEQGKAEVLGLYRSFVVKTLSFSMPIILIAILFAPQILSLLFTDKYLSATPFFRIYTASFVVAMFGAGTILRAIGKTKLSLKAYLISAIISVPLSVFLIQKYSIYGAIAGAMLNMNLPRIFQMIYEAKQLNISMLKLVPLRSIGTILLCTLLPLLPIIFASFYFDISIFLSVFVGGVYLIVSYILEMKAGTFIVPQQLVVEKIKSVLQRVRLCGK